MQTLTSHIFGTLTYKRSCGLHESWARLSKDFNRYIQRFRRLHNSPIQYIRSVEAHADNYPHIHVILQFPTPITVLNAKYVDRALYLRWKNLWRFGLSDYQAPLRKTKPILYIIKYISKDSSGWRTLWKKLLADSPTVAQSNTSSTSPASPSANAVKFVSTNLFCKEHKIRQISWSRGFIFPRLTPDHSLSLLQKSLPEFTS